MASSGSPPPRRLLLILSTVAAVTLTVVGLLLFQTRSTIVEIHATLDRVDLTVVPGATWEVGDLSQTVLDEVHLLGTSFFARRLDLRGADRIETYLENSGRTTLHPGPQDSAHLTGEQPFPVYLSIYGPTPLSIAIGRAGSSGRALRFTLSAPGPGGQSWRGVVPANPGLALLAPGPDGPVQGTIAEDTLDVTLAGGKNEAVLSLFLPEERGAASVLRLIDPLTGDTEEKALPFAISEPRALAWGNRLALLEPVSASSQPLPLLRPGLTVIRPRFFESRRFEEKSFLLGGKIRFPGGEKEELEIEPQSLLSMESEEPFTLRSATFQEGRLAIILWGRATSVRLGPTPELQAEELPSLFVWIYTHRLRALVYSTVASILGLSLAVIKTFGLFKE